VPLANGIVLKDVEGVITALVSARSGLWFYHFLISRSVWRLGDPIIVSQGSQYLSMEFSI
jgi:hypothetical protein